MWEESVCYKIFIRLKKVCDEIYEKDEFIFIVSENKEYVLLIIIICLEEFICFMLNKWYDNLKKEGLSKWEFSVIVEIGVICK